MAQDVLAYPFRLNPTSGSFVHVSDDSDEYKGQQISAFIRTFKDERPIFSDFGVLDPSFFEFDIVDFVDSFTDYYPVEEIKITGVQSNTSQGVTPDIIVNFS